MSSLPHCCSRGWFLGGREPGEDGTPSAVAGWWSRRQAAWYPAGRRPLVL